MDLISIFTYIGVAYGLMCISRTCGLPNPWLSWIPFADAYQLGLVADHYMARLEGRQTRQRKTLLTVRILLGVAALLVIISLMVGVIIGLSVSGIDLGAFISAPYGSTAPSGAHESVDGAGLTVLMWVLLTTLPMLLIFFVVVLIHAVLHFIALHRVYKLVAPDTATLYTVLSVLINVAQPIILLIIAKKAPSYPPEDAPTGVVKAPDEPAVDAASYTYTI